MSFFFLDDFSCSFVISSILLPIFFIPIFICYTPPPPSPAPPPRTKATSDLMSLFEPAPPVSPVKAPKKVVWLLTCIRKIMGIPTRASLRFGQQTEFLDNSSKLPIFYRSFSNNRSEAQIPTYNNTKSVRRQRGPAGNYSFSQISFMGYTFSSMSTLIMKPARIVADFASHINLNLK